MNVSVKVKGPLPELLVRYRGELVRSLQGTLRGRSFLFEMMRYSLGLRRGEKIRDGLGKALRPTLCLFACEAVGGEWREALPAAIALELVHNFSLVHDDIQDGDKERRHRPTVWVRWGVGQAINAGDALHALSSLVLCELKERTSDALSLLAGATFEMIEGQCLDLEYEGRFDLTVQDYLSMISRKTGALMGCALELGALLGGADLRKMKLFKKAGCHLGSAFQIRDDLLGIWGTPDITGKPSEDLWKRRRTLPIVYALECPQSRPRLLQYLKLKLSSPTEEDVNALKTLLEEIGADRYAQALAEEHARAAYLALEEIGLPSASLAEAKELFAFAVNRGL